MNWLTKGRKASINIKESDEDFKKRANFLILPSMSKTDKKRQKTVGFE